MMTELRQACRSLRRRPGFTLVAVATLGIGIGANAAVFGLLATVLTKNAPGVAAPGQLAVLCRTTEGLGWDRFSYPDYLDYRDLTQSFSGLAAYADTVFSLSDGDSPERLDGAVVSGNYFAVLGVPVEFGAQPDRTIVISHRLWQRRYGARASLVGQSVRLNGRLYTVAGIAPEAFLGTELDSPLDVWAPIAAQSPSARPDPWSDPRNRRDRFLVVVGRLRPSVTFEQARAEVGTIGRQLELTYPTAYSAQQTRHQVMLDRRAALSPLTRGIAAAVLGILMCAVAFVLVIACANVAQLLLIRAMARSRETAVRLALGAGRVHLVGQVLSESLLLSLAGGAIGLLLASWISKLLTLAIQDLRFVESRLDAPMAVFAVLLSLITGCLTGLIPAVRCSRSNIASALKAGAGGAAANRLGVRSLLVVAEVGLAAIVVIGAGLLAGSARNVAAVDRGFSTDHVVMMSIDPARIGYEAERRLALYRELFSSLNEAPGVVAATLAGRSALDMAFPGTFVPDGLQDDPGARFEAHSDVIAPRYLEVLQIPLVAGRDFTERDNPSAPRVIIVNEALALRLWPGENPLGKRLRMAGLWIGPPLEVVGLARNTRQLRLEEAPAPFVYLPLFQQNADHVRIHIRCTSDIGSVVPVARRAIHTLDKDLPAYDVESLDDHIAAELTLLRSFASVVTAFGAVALVLATVGLYVVMSYSVAQRTREIGLRMAVGAGRGDVLSLILGQSMRLVLGGLAVGAFGALALTRVLQEALYGLSAADPVTYGGASLLLALVAVTAACVPARRAMRVDPMAALREE